eukprot:g624.t1
MYVLKRTNQISRQVHVDRPVFRIRPSKLQRPRRHFARLLATGKPQWLLDLEADADMDPAAAKVLEGANGDPNRVLENIRAEQEKLKSEDLIQQRTGSETPVNIRFREIDPQHLWLWFEFNSAPSVSDAEMLSEVLKSWFMIGKLGGYNSANLQISHGPAEKLNFFPFDKKRSSEALDAFMHELTELETNGLWARVKVDMGTADELCLDVLINTILTFSKEYVGIKNLIIGGVNKDWPITIKDSIPSPMEDGELDQRMAELAKSLGKSKDDTDSIPSLAHLFGEEDQEFDANGTVIALNNPQGRNCVNVQLLEELNFLMSELSEQWSLRSLILKSTVDECFSSGLDLVEYTALTDEEVAYVAQKTRELCLKLTKFPIPTIAVVEGMAIGSGAELALSCDFRIGTNDALFAFPETRLGLIPLGGGCQRLAKLIGRTRAKELIFTGRKITSKEALELGLLNSIHDENCEEKVIDFVKEMNSGAPLALRAAKRAIEDASDLDYEQAIEKDYDFLRLLLPREDRLEGVKAIVEKRQPFYKGN